MFSLLAGIYQVSLRVYNVYTTYLMNVYFPDPGDLLFDPFWEAVMRLERCGFKVLATTFDGASVNRRLVKIHCLGASDLLHKVINPFAPEKRYLYFFSDPPHLVKTVRNCWASKSRNLWVSALETKDTHKFG